MSKRQCIVILWYICSAECSGNSIILIHCEGTWIRANTIRPTNKLIAIIRRCRDSHLLTFLILVVIWINTNLSTYAFFDSKHMIDWLELRIQFHILIHNDSTWVIGITIAPLCKLIASISHGNNGHRGTLLVAILQWTNHHLSSFVCSHIELIAWSLCYKVCGIFAVLHHHNRTLYLGITIAPMRECITIICDCFEGDYCTLFICIEIRSLHHQTSLASY